MGKLLILYIFISSNLFHSITFAEVDLLEDYCTKLDGVVKFGFICPKSKLPLPINMCQFTNSHGKQQFFDGCTGPTGGYKELFYPACIKHDLCYHHEPATNDLEQKDCDTLFLTIMKKSCHDQPDKKDCLKWANTLYRGVRMVGKLAFHCENTKGAY